MTIFDKIKKTFQQLGVSDAQGVESLFTELRKAAEKERAELVARGATSQAQRERLCKMLRDRWLARKGGILSQVDENWLKPATKDLKPAVGRQFNELRRSTANLEFEPLVEATPLQQARSLQMGLPLPPQAGAAVPRDLTLPGIHRRLGPSTP